MKYVVLLFIILSMTMQSALAQQSKYALVRRIQGLELLHDPLPRQLQALTLKVITTKTDYDLLLSAQDTPTATSFKVVALETEVAKIKDRYRIEARLLDLKNQSIINKASMDNIREEDLVRLFQAALESLFIKDPKVKETPEKTVSDNLKRNNDQPEITHVKPQPSSSIDFRQRIMGIKADADDAIKNEIEENQKESESAENSKKAQSENGLNPMLPKIVSTEHMTPDPHKTGKSFAKTYEISVGHESRQIKSNYLIGTLTKAQFLKVDAKGWFPMPFFEGNIKLQSGISYAHPITSEVEPPSIYSADLSAGWFESLGNVHFGMNYDSSFFVNLPSPGAGLQTETITSLWMKIQAEYTFEIKGKPWLAGITYSIPLSGQTSFSPLKSASSWGGAATSFKLAAPYSYKEWKTNFAFDQINLHSQGEKSFTLYETRYALSVWRSL